MLFSSVFYLLVGQWAYNEIKVVAPWAIPVVDRFLSQASLPTHDKWGVHMDGVRDVVNQHKTLTQVGSELEKKVTQKLKSALDTPEDFKF